MMYWEHVGRMDDPHYANELILFVSQGIFRLKQECGVI